MTPLYLKHIALRQFRSFATLDVDLPPRPGVLIVHGSNGLGKSSLFDALEWALSDKIDHFRDANGVNKPGKYLCRWRDAQAGPTSTTITFSDGNVIERSLSSQKAVKSNLGGSITDIIEFLRSPSWQQSISDLQRYLLLTHFLGQSTLSRLTYRKADERFDILKEAAQSTAIEGIATALHGQGNSTAVRAYNRQIDVFEREAAGFGELIEQEAALWSEAQLSGAIDDERAALEARQIALVLAQARYGDRVLPSIGIEGELTIERLQATADQIERDCLAAEQQLEGARRLHAEKQRATADLAEVQASRTVTQARMDGLGSELEQARKVQSERRSNVATQQGLVAAANTAFGNVRRLFDARSVLLNLETDSRQSSVALAAAEDAKSAAERDVVLEERKRDLLQQIRSQLSRCDEEIADLHGRALAFDEAIATEERISLQSNELAELELGNPDLNVAVSLADETAAEAMAASVAQSQAVAALRQTVDEMSSAIASIATQLPADACDCPLCATHFDSASALRGRVSRAAERLAPVLVGQENLNRELSRAAEQRQEEQQQLRATQAAIVSGHATLKAERMRHEQLLATLNQGSTDRSGSLVEQRAQLTNAIAKLNARRFRKLRWQTHSALGGQGANENHSRVVRVLGAAQRALDAANRRSIVLSGALQRANTEEATAKAALSLDRVISADELSLMLAEADTAAVRADEGATIAGQALVQADATIATLDAEQAALRARLTENDRRITELERIVGKIGEDWRRLGRFGDIVDLQPIQAVESRISVSRRALKESSGQLTRLRDGRLAQAKQVRYRAVFEQLRELADAPPSPTRDELLARANWLRARKRADAEDVRRVKEIARLASADISEELESFNSEYIKPLGFLMTRINQAILCDPNVGIDLHVKKKKIEQSAVKGLELPKALGDIDPMLVHSEGQMAALAVSMLCAASLKFPWSRWKALVLDDPLQHNDSIHAAAFADLMGNLVTSEGYQVLLSTHDLAQSEFLQRKFRSRSIPCTTLNLRGLGKDGVEWSVQESPVFSTRVASA